MPAVAVPAAFARASPRPVAAGRLEALVFGPGDFAATMRMPARAIGMTDAWDAATKTGKITTEIKGAPVKVTADMKLEASGKGAVNRMVWTLSCGIPLVGGKLESILAEDVKVKSKRDEAASQTLLEGY